MSESAGTMRESGIIRLHRQPRFYRDQIRAYQVRIDDNLTGKIAEGETKDFFVPPRRAPGPSHPRQALGQPGGDAQGSRRRTGRVHLPSRRAGATEPVRAAGPARYIRLNGPTVTIRT